MHRCLCALTACLLVAGGALLAAQNVDPQRNARSAQAPDKTGSTRRLPIRWWKDEAIAARLGLTRSQVSRIDKVFEEFLPGQRQRWETFRPLEKELDDLLREPQPDEAKVVDRIARVEALRSELNRHRLVMLFHIRQILTTAQRQQLETLGWPSTGPRRH